MSGQNRGFIYSVLHIEYEGHDDKQLLDLIARRTRGALEAFYDRYAGAVYSLSMRMLRESAAAEEVTQDVFFSVWRRASSYSAQRGSVTAWLFSIAHHRTIDELRRRRREQSQIQQGVDIENRPSGAGSDPVEHVTAELARVKVKAALNTLKAEQQEVVMLAYYGGLTHSEIATHLGQPLGTVKTRMRLALKKLREVLGPQVQEGTEHGL